jgi:Pyruvate/2-oxoacid:ferredoxin oxidoreductase delta subunit
VKKEIKNVNDSLVTETNDGWRVAEMVVNYEDIVHCEHCNDRIISAYIEDDIIEWHQTLEELTKLDANGATMYFLPDSIQTLKEDIDSMRFAIETIEGNK